MKANSNKKDARMTVCNTFAINLQNSQKESKMNTTKTNSQNINVVDVVNANEELRALIIKELYANDWEATAWSDHFVTTEMVCEITALSIAICVIEYFEYSMLNISKEELEKLSFEEICILMHKEQRMDMKATWCYYFYHEVRDIVFGKFHEKEILTNEYMEEIEKGLTRIFEDFTVWNVCEGWEIRTSVKRKVQ